MLIRLLVRTRLDLDAIEAGVALRLFRITAAVSILTPSGWSLPREGIIDTGNPVTLVPHRAWSGASVEFLTPPYRPLQGLGSTAQTAIRGRLGRLTPSIEDGQTSSPPLQAVAYLLDDNRAPLLLGCEGILTRGTLITNLKDGQASLEF